MLALVTLLGLVLRLYGVADQPLLSDDVLMAYSADNYMERGVFGPSMSMHPNLRNILVHWSVGVFGPGAVGLRFWSLLLGVLGVPVLGLLVSRLTASETAGVVAALLLAADPVHITFSRQAIQEVQTTFWFLLGCLLFALAHGAGWRMKRAWLVPLAGVAFGLGLACKAHAAFPLAVCTCLGLWYAARDRRWDDLAVVGVSLVLVPLAVFVLTYLPWFGRGYGLAEWVFMQRALAEYMVAHQGTPLDSMVDTQAWLWFVKPFMGYGSFTATEGGISVNVAMGNPLVWLAVLPSAWIAYGRKSEGRLLMAFFWVSYLPLVFSPRPIWLLSSLAVTPFAFGMVGLAIASVRERVGQRAIAVYLGLVMLVTLLMYPLATGNATHYPHLAPLVERLNPHTHDLLRGEQR
jgi:4-amino-4-deoxy-L-arabinose transferase-like glycosyltransferase